MLLSTPFLQLSRKCFGLSGDGLTAVDMVSVIHYIKEIKHRQTDGNKREFPSVMVGISL